MSKKKVVLVTGASRGIGFLTVKTLVQEGHYVVAAMRDIIGRNKRNAQALYAWAEDLIGSVEVIEMDITDERAVNLAVQSLEQRLEIDVLINNAGVMPVGITEANTPAADDSNCLHSYGEKARYPNKMVAMFEDMFAAKESITNAQNVADKISTLINMDGNRPIRTTVGGDMGLIAINESAAPIQADLIASLQPLIGAPTKDNRLYIAADVCLKPEYFARGKAALESILKPTLNESGCHVFSLMESQTDANKLHLFEIFENEQALEQHYQKDYTKAVFANYDKWLSNPIEVRKMKSASMTTSMQF